MEETDPNSEIPFEQIGMWASDHCRHRRWPMRLPGYDYSRPGAYFVTLCTHEKIPLFGRVEDGRMVLNAAGEVVAETWLWLGTQYDYVQLDSWQVMPNHLHGILMISSSTTVGSGEGACRGGSRTAPTGCPRKPLGRLIGAFKTVSTKRLNQLRRTPGARVWQRNYYEHVLRNDQSLEQIREYIRDNPIRWDLDPENPNARL